MIFDRDIIGRAVAWLPQSLREAPNVLRSLRLLGEEAQDVQMLAAQVVGGLRPENARGWHLLQWCRRVSVAADALTDFERSRLVRSKLLVIWSSGDPERLRSIAKTALDAATVRLQIISTNQLGIHVESGTASSTAALAEAYAQLQSAAPAGDLIAPITIGPTVEPFVWSEEPEASWDDRTWYEAL